MIMHELVITLWNWAELDFSWLFVVFGFLENIWRKPNYQQMIEKVRWYFLLSTGMV